LRRADPPPHRLHQPVRVCDRQDTIEADAEEGDAMHSRGVPSYALACDDVERRRLYSRYTVIAVREVEPTTVCLIEEPLEVGPVLRLVGRLRVLLQRDARLLRRIACTHRSSCGVSDETKRERLPLSEREVEWLGATQRQ